MSAVFGPLGSALLQLCSRPEGWRHDATGRAEIERITGRLYKPSDISPRIRRYAARGLISTADSARGATWRTTAKGRGRAAGSEMREGRRKRAPGVKVITLGDWAKAPMQGSVVRPQRQAVSVPCPNAPAVDERYCVDPKTFQGGELSRLGIGRYSSEANTCAARAAGVR